MCIYLLIVNKYNLQCLIMELSISFRTFGVAKHLTMEKKTARCIRSVEIQNLWSRRSHVKWQLKPDVNVLSGVNGMGKSTILNRLIDRLDSSRGDVPDGNMLHGVRIVLEPTEANHVKYDVIRSFDRPLVIGQAVEKLTGTNVITELDWQLYRLQRRYLDYQVNIGNSMIAMLTSGAPDARERAEELAAVKVRFQDTVDELFAETGKNIDRTSNEIAFMQLGEKLLPYQLSSGEKQMLVILLTALTEDGQPYVLFMDEPEISLHIDWQQKLISIIRKLNPNVQIILTTHSPAVIMDGWLDTVTDVADIIV